MTKPARTGMVEANGTQLYYELRGAGPSLLFIPGAEGDAAEYARVVNLLRDEFTILCYDRRAISRSPRPADYASATVEEQADDAAALLDATGIGPAAVWGNSSGAIIGLSLCLRHPRAVTAAMLHEPPLFSGMSDVGKVLGFLQEATANGKVPFLRMLTGDIVYDSLAADYRERLAADTTFLEFEFDNFEYYRPSDEELAGMSTPVAVLCGSDSPPFFMEAARWLAERLGTDVTIMPGNHGVHYELPDDVVKVIRSFLAPEV
jgi:pimeloyl-ACP methyl ester carboxylesterase